MRQSGIDGSENTRKIYDCVRAVSIILLLIFGTSNQNYVSAIEPQLNVLNLDADESRAYDPQALHIPLHLPNYELLTSITANAIKPESAVKSPVPGLQAVQNFEPLDKYSSIKPHFHVPPTEPPAYDLLAVQNFEPLAKDSSTERHAHDPPTEPPAHIPSVKSHEPTSPITDAPTKHTTHDHLNDPPAHDPPSEPFARVKYSAYVPPVDYSMHNSADKDADHDKSFEASLAPSADYGDVEVAESYRMEDVANPAKYWGETLYRIDVGRAERRQNWKWYERYSNP